ncbi:MAG: YezD family protein [Opitutaceae bacterium]|jgi:hypothetical protein
MSTTVKSQVSPSETLLPAWLEIVRQKVEGLRYGVVQIVVHDSRVTQIERTEKTRLPGQSDLAE